MDIIFELKNVSYSYIKSIPALIDVSFNVNKGEKLIILGANGSGKSTLLKLMDGLIKPDKGDILAFGKSILNMKNDEEYEFRRKVGYLFQDSDVQLFNTSVFDEVAFAPLQIGLEIKDVKSMVDKTLESFGLEKLRDRPPHRLSGGEKKKVALASIMVINPEVLLLDEPTNGLDPRSRKWLINMLINLGNRGKTLIISTHDLDLAKSLADRIVIMNESHTIETIGKPHEILDNSKLLESVNLI
ncbi:nickel ABC transporter ATP-binding protein [Thermoanaerobacterium thermosaccharolyticum]|uniref:Nickel ABC transporter ATP-binding protein n=1 Tax=Thermoanaerobacterium thermosaccharolyticum TaxID=1517 RepID=A0A231VMR0_THETR|nr:ABC transporter ATP-binding protein [Thermoanaerobacterium thermosaccharolyticum]OXT09241.1 nickel ABC transporter ATP-binding protein [Thermoanaerobacterium thermosaccharolyticum]PHO07238.1 nickel ABC transporter ATP-binding protein [Thermoanaerobacterium thermosaccharolyticum]